MASQIRFEVIVALGSLTLAAGWAQAQSHPLLLATLRGENALEVIDPVSGNSVARMATGEEPHNVAVSDHGKLAFVANRMGGSISVIDLGARKEIRRVEIGSGSRPHGIAFAAGKVYFTAEPYKLVGCYDPSANRMDWLLGIGQHLTDGMLIVSKDGNSMITDNRDSATISLMERITNSAGAKDWEVTAIPVGKGPEGLAVSPDGKELWVSQKFDGGISIVNIQTRKVTGTIAVQPKGKESNRLRFTPDAKLVLITDLGGGLTVLDRATRKEVKRIHLGNHTAGILMTSDGSRAYVSLGEDNKIAVFDLKTLTVTGMIGTGKRPEGMAWVE